MIMRCPRHTLELERALLVILVQCYCDMSLLEA